MSRKNSRFVPDYRVLWLDEESARRAKGFSEPIQEPFSGASPALGSRTVWAE